MRLYLKRTKEKFEKEMEKIGAEYIETTTREAIFKMPEQKGENRMGINRAWPIIADSAEPKSIEEVHRLGFNIHPANKGQDSIRNSIDILKRQPLLVTRESTNLIKELRNYTWDTDKTGASLGVPVDRYNHAIDAVRYVALNKVSANAGGRYVIM